MPALTIGTRRCQCAACGEYFSSVHTFDRHQKLTGDRYRPTLVCLPPASVGLVMSEDGWWTGAPMPNGVFTLGQNQTKTKNTRDYSLSPCEGRIGEDVER